MLTLRLRGIRAILLIGCALLFAALPVRADWKKVEESGTLKVAVYKEFAPFSDRDQGIDVDLAAALARKLSLKLSLLPFPAGENLNDDLRNMVWKGHYLGYGPADVLLHVPVDRNLMASNDKVEIFAPYHVESLRLVRSARSIPHFEGVESLAGKRIGVEQVSLAGMLMLGEGGGRFRDNVRLLPTSAEALQQLKAGQLDAVLATRSEIEASLRGDPAFPLEQVSFQRMPRAGWAVGMAVRKDSTDVARKLQAALNELAASGELKAIFARHGVQLVQP
ncbi:MAG: amino acid transporter substrate-binding protein [Pseudoduganella sp.]|jgi:ABC-type amino acid transport substrate-binding protein|nr:amino acid transporter substrate-binding protein [Pseudoduganella sp.]